MFLNLLVVIKAPEIVEDTIFISLKMMSRLAFLIEENNKIRTQDMSLNIFITSE
jgi:hypothetical protein